MQPGPRWAAIKRDFKIPIIMQSPPLGPVRMLTREVADVYMIGGDVDNVLGWGFA